MASYEMGILPSATRRYSRLKICATVVGIALGLLNVKTSRGSENGSGLDWTANSENTSWTVSYQGQKILVYTFERQKFKPYVKELYTLTGDNILRDAPHDHLHHHALMYAIKVNGINFWEEISGSGVEKPIQTAKPELGFKEVEGRHLPQAMLTQTIHWLAAQDAFLPDSPGLALLIEHRTLTLTLDPSRQEVALEWKGHFEVGGKTNTVTLTGATYHGLGMRFRQDLDPIAVHSLAGVRPDLANNRQEVSPASWGSVSFNSPGHPATIALAGHPANAREQATFFSMLTPFAYLSATQGLNQEPLVYRTGDQFELKYLVLLYPSLPSGDALGKRFQTWKENH